MSMEKVRRFSGPVLAGALLFCSLPIFAQSERSGKDGSGKVGRLVVVGDSLSAGFQNFSLFDSDSAPMVPPGGQKHGIPLWWPRKRASASPCP
jgi:hypothetical protein